MQLLDLDDGVAHLLLKGSCNGCAASASTLELAIETALEEDAPDLAGIEVEGAVDKVRAPTVSVTTRLPIVQVASTPGWVADSVAAGSRTPRWARPAGGLIVANVAGTLLAYRDRCASCGSSLIGGELVDGDTPVPVVLAPVLATARRALAWTRRISSSSRCRCSRTTPA